MVSLVVFILLTVALAVVSILIWGQLREAQQTIDNTGKRTRLIVSDKGGDVFGGWWESGQAEGGSTDQGSLVRHGRGCQIERGKLGFDEGIDPIRCPVALNPGKGLFDRGTISPVFQTRLISFTNCLSYGERGKESY